MLLKAAAALIPYFGIKITSPMITITNAIIDAVTLTEIKPLPLMNEANKELIHNQNIPGR